MVHIGVVRAIGAAVVGVAQVGAMDVEAGATDEAMLEGTPVAVDFMVAKASMVVANSTVEAFMGEADSTVVADTGADAANKIQKQKRLAASRCQPFFKSLAPVTVRA